MITERLTLYNTQTFFNEDLPQALLLFETGQIALCFTGRPLTIIIALCFARERQFSVRRETFAVALDFPFKKLAKIASTGLLKKISVPRPVLKPHIDAPVLGNAVCEIACENNAGVLVFHAYMDCSFFFFFFFFFVRVR